MRLYTGHGNLHISDRCFLYKVCLTLYSPQTAGFNETLPASNIYSLESCHIVQRYSKHSVHVLNRLADQVIMHQNLCCYRNLLGNYCFPTPQDQVLQSAYGTFSNHNDPFCNPTLPLPSDSVTCKISPILACRQHVRHCALCERHRSGFRQHTLRSGMSESCTVCREVN